MRAPVDIIVAVHEADAGHQIGAGKIVDISVAGAKLLSPTRLGNEGQTIWLLFKVKLADMEEYVKTSAVIRTVGEETDEKGMRIESYGVEFGELSQTERLIVMNQVYQHLLNEHL
jgi:hypothetical protein